MILQEFKSATFLTYLTFKEIKEEFLYLFKELEKYFLNPFNATARR